MRTGTDHWAKSCIWRAIPSRTWWRRIRAPPMRPQAKSQNHDSIPSNHDILSITLLRIRGKLLIIACSVSNRDFPESLPRRSAMPRNLVSFLFSFSDVWRGLRAPKLAGKEIFEEDYTSKTNFCAKQLCTIECLYMSDLGVSLNQQDPHGVAEHAPLQSMNGRPHTYAASFRVQGIGSSDSKLTMVGEW